MYCSNHSDADDIDEDDNYSNDTKGTTLDVLNHTHFTTNFFKRASSHDNHAICESHMNSLASCCSAIHFDRVEIAFILVYIHTGTINR